MSHASSRRIMLALPLAAAALGLTGAVVAQPRPAAAASPFMGSWELDLTRMPDTYGPPPKRVVYAFEDVGAGQWRTTVDITAPDDSVRHMAATYRPDGTMAPGEGDTSEADSAAVMTPSPNVMVMNLAKDKRLGSVRVYTISPDGKEMTESAAGMNGDGEPFVREFRFKRVR